MAVIGLPIDSRLSLLPYGMNVPLRTLIVTVGFGPVNVMSELDVTDSHFWKRRGLSDYDGVSFESAKRPGHFLRHRGPGTKIELTSRLFDPWLAPDATFRPHNAGSHQRFESMNYPGTFLRRVGDQLRLTTIDYGVPYTWGFHEGTPRSLGQPINAGPWTSVGGGRWQAERSGPCTGLTPVLGGPRVTVVAATLTTGRVVASAAISTRWFGLYPVVRLTGGEYFEPPSPHVVYSIDRAVMPCVW